MGDAWAIVAGQWHFTIPRHGSPLQGSAPRHAAVITPGASRKLRDIRRDPPRFFLGHEIGGSAPSALFFVIHVGDINAVRVLHDEVCVVVSAPVPRARFYCDRTLQPPEKSVTFSAGGGDERTVQPSLSAFYAAAISG
jgi:hypothetical protein